jgi:signal transduction histidine kinase
VFLAGVAGAGGVALGVVYGLEDAVLVAAMLFAGGGAVLGLAHLAVRHRNRLGSLSRQFQVAVALALGLVLVGVGMVALAMFISTHDAFLMGLLLLFAGAVAAYAASLVAREVMRDIRSLRDVVVAVGEGRRDVSAETGASDELADLAAAANRMTAQLSEGEARSAAAWAAHRDLVAAVSHDLRTPLASLQVLAEAVDDDVVDEATRQRYLAQMSIQIRSLGSLVDDLFELSRLEAGDVEWSMQQVKLDELVGETVEAMEPQAGAKGIAVLARVPTELAPARANPEKVQRVLFNLMQNAIRHTPPDGSVTVAAESNGSNVEIEVSDSGSGVAAEDRERVFEAFYRGGEEAARTRSGAGLGLTICRAIVEAHGGRIWLADSPRGTRVRFSLPAAA